MTWALAITAAWALGVVTTWAWIRAATITATPSPATSDEVLDTWRDQAPRSIDWEA